MTYIALISLTVILAIAGIILGIKAKKASAKNTELEANVAKLTATLNDEKEKAAKQAENAHATQANLNNMLNRQQEEYQKLSKSYDELRLACSSVEAAKAAANKANTEAAQAKEEADRAKTEAAEAMQRKAEAEEAIAKAQEQLEAITADIRAGQEKLCSLSKLYEAITGNEELPTITNLQVESEALLEQAKAVHTSIELAEKAYGTFRQRYGESYSIASIVHPHTLLCGYDSYGNLSFVGSIPKETDRGFIYRHDHHVFQIFNDDETIAQKQQEKLKQSLEAANVTKIICFATKKAANATTTDGKSELTFVHTRTVCISIHAISWINMEQDERRLYELLGCDRQKEWRLVYDDLIKRRQEVEDRICELANAETQSFLADALIHKSAD